MQVLLCNAKQKCDITKNAFSSRLARVSLKYLLIMYGNVYRTYTRVSKSVLETELTFARLHLVINCSVNLLVSLWKIIGMNKSHRWVWRLPFPSRYVHNSNNSLSFNVNFTDYDADEIICHVAPCYTFLVHRRHSGRI